MHVEEKEKEEWCEEAKEKWCEWCEEDWWEQNGECQPCPAAAEQVNKEWYAQTWLIPEATYFGMH